jgi:hypothetical protein
VRAMLNPCLASLESRGHCVSVPGVESEPRRCWSVPWLAPAEGVRYVAPFLSCHLSLCGGSSMSIVMVS